MSGDKLTRTELAWLLTQEARSAAQKLRKGVSLTIPPPEATPTPSAVGNIEVLLPGAPAHDKSEDAAGVESVLNRLDETMSALASLHGHSARARRGKVDIAALIWEVAPEARVQIEMGKGLVVFGDENELRRMLNVLMAQGGDPVASHGVEVTVKRDGDEIRIAVQLGPDKSQGYETETQWLSRMAVRYGGRLTLEGDKQTLILPANDEHREVETLRRELAAAQAQGEAYARELAAVMGKTEPPPSVRSSLSQAPGGDAMGVLVATSRAILSDIRGVLAAIGRDIAPLRDKARWGEKGDDVAEIGASVARHVTAASEVVSDLSKLASCPLYELPSPVNIADLVREAAEAVKPRAARHEVTVEIEELAPVTTPEGIPPFSPHAGPPGGPPPPPSPDVLNAGTVSVLVQELLNNAINASNAGTAVKVAVHETVTGVTLIIDDTGTPLSQKAKTSVPNRDFDALAQERSSTLPLIAAASIAAYLHAPFSVEDSPAGGTRARVTFPRPA